METTSLCTPNNIVKGFEKEFTSESGKYKIVLTMHSVREQGWNYSRAEVYLGNNMIVFVERNYPQFPFYILENHPDGHDYLFCGADYQAQTVIRLDTGERKDYRKEKAMKAGWSFCWGSIGPASPSKTKLMVCGCYWACPYEHRVYDISNPMETLYPIWQEDCDEIFEDFKEWVGEDKAIFTVSIQFRKSDGKLYSELTDEEERLADTNKDYDYRSEDTPPIVLKYVDRLENDIAEENNFNDEDGNEETTD